MPTNRSPASHVAEIKFSLPPDFVGGGVGSVPGILMKSSEQARGTPLAALAVKVTDGFFLVGLSNVPTDSARNLQLMLQRTWFDIPVLHIPANAAPSSRSKRERPVRTPSRPPSVRKNSAIRCHKCAVPRN